MAGHERELPAECPLHLPAWLNTRGYTSHTQEQTLEFHIFQASLDGEKALRPGFPLLSEAFWGALLQLVSRAALTRIINPFWLGGGKMCLG